MLLAFQSRVFQYIRGIAATDYVPLACTLLIMLHYQLLKSLLVSLPFLLVLNFQLGCQRVRRLLNHVDPSGLLLFDLLHEFGHLLSMTIPHQIFE